MIARLRKLATTRPSVVTAGTGIGAGLVAAGFAMIGITWAGASRTLDVQSQMAYIVSGGLGSLVLVALGMAVVVIQVLRRCGAAERAAFREVIEAAAERPPVR